MHFEIKQKEHTIDYYIRQVWHKTARLYNLQADKFGSTMSVGFVLLYVDKEGTPSTQLGPRMGMEPTSLSRLLKTMEQNNLIYRKPDDKDKRKSLIFLTPDGVKKRKIAKEVVLGFNEYIYKNIEHEKLQTFFEVIDQIDQLIDQRRDEINGNQ